MQSQVPYLHTDNSFTITSKEELVQAFRIRDQKKLILPEKLKFPFKVKPYLTWREPSSVYTYLVFKLPIWDLPRGVAFKRTHISGEPSGGLCNWCHSYGSSEEISLLNVTMSSKESSSYYICNDLRCAEKIEEAANLAGKNPEKNLLELFQRMEKLFENISNFENDI